MNNPFEVLDSRLSNIERLLLDIKHNPQLAPPTTDTGDLLTVEGVSNLLKLSRQTIYNLVSAGRIPHMKNGHRVRFSKAEITTWLKSGRRKTVTEIEAAVETYVRGKNKKR